MIRVAGPTYIYVKLIYQSHSIHYLQPLYFFQVNNHSRA